MQFALYEPCSKDDDTDNKADDNINDKDEKNICFYKGGCRGSEDGVWCQLIFLVP